MKNLVIIMICMVMSINSFSQGKTPVSLEKRSFALTLLSPDFSMN